MGHAELPRYHNHGDTIAVQYGGSHLVNTMETYRKINQWTSQGREMVESFKRYYNNSFVDGQRQEAYNLFLGNYIFVQGQPMLWDLPTDYYLHHADPRLWSANNRKSYTHWYTDAHLADKKWTVAQRKKPLVKIEGVQDVDNYWLEYYRPSSISSFPKMFSFRINSSLRYIPFGTAAKSPANLSPFLVRMGSDRDGTSGARPKKGVKILESPAILNAEDDDDEPEKTEKPTSPGGRRSMEGDSYSKPGILKDLPAEPSPGYTTAPTTPGTGYLKDKAATAQWALNQFVVTSLSPIVAANELAEYSRYISHPQKLPLVVSMNDSAPPKTEYLSYLKTDWTDETSPENVSEYSAYLVVEDEPLTVNEDDAPKRRYKAYQQWLKGKSLFKQPRTDL